MFLTDKASANIIQKLPTRRSWPLFPRNGLAHPRDPGELREAEQPRRLCSPQSMSLKFAALFILIQRNWSNDITGRGSSIKSHTHIATKLTQRWKDGGVGGELVLTKQPHSSFKEALSLLLLHKHRLKLLWLRSQGNLCNLSWASSEKPCLT